MGKHGRDERLAGIDGGFERIGGARLQENCQWTINRLPKAGGGLCKHSKFFKYLAKCAKILLSVRHCSDAALREQHSRTSSASCQDYSCPSFVLNLRIQAFRPLKSRMLEFDEFLSFRYLSLDQPLNHRRSQPAQTRQDVCDGDRVSRDIEPS